MFRTIFNILNTEFHFDKNRFLLLDKQKNKRKVLKFILLHMNIDS